jgi:hypothetical protein
MELERKSWWPYIHEDLKELLKEAIILRNRVENWDEKFHDYSFVVFPAAKAYEGFLKTLFLDLGFISDKAFYGKRFRVGRALNPALEKKYREKEGVYDHMVEHCGGKDTADILWKTWKRCRNLLFHWFPNEKNAINFPEASERVDMVIAAIDLAFKECKIDRVRD